MNNQIFFFFYNLAHRSVFFDQLIIFIADIFPYIVVILAVISLIIYKEKEKKTLKQIISVVCIRWKEITFVFFSAFLAWILAYILKYLFHTERPFDVFSSVTSLFSETGYAFPSGHATFFMALAVALFFYSKKVGYIFIFFALLIGIARIMSGVHFPVDIFGGFILGFLIAFFLKNV
ncbi:MAG: Phosphoesterase PA-phosphatase related protein [Candidatus Nomurabacteria bacterium GW2011_GWE1_32_28]|uniref:Phosphoesterase PA-phosphatase related protein n=1 Tax=Candidatus Nomurabacteria bacterium GW2011_GWF1_31_48 TaxID=1618767 RepID=A0A0G0BFI7_9BACT|nr:MAG: Phosphoesterase PA-phosphatase related protein [Candidatus Nomurabacteria bacterium GW2011_GWF2_30_133]KKP28247.1 MAG: Phosphoesterase PA-phosphatase related protein [Candidatus Nomurabacteria bacterium GW2011_GWE2_31_40]KKP29842.1 MAG: Phosphoesterase PA-phosphatase related protein [Candidatus Nomurabacteria bacterium GW2011_GWF1_31_48]KKP34583.1 MAG: Phosphoesterase PA-phosphatase related protein [Candidatus Nomurabacteria bacterium GW2011_GWE1_32_28]HAS80433.1 hypothetical protein [C